MNNHYLEQLQERLADSLEAEDIMDHIDLDEVFTEDYMEDTWGE